MLFRMEDLDPARSKPAYIAALGEDLRWLGLDWDEGWPDPSCAQSARTAAYDAAFSALQRRGLVYPCYCSRHERMAASAPHPGEAADSGCRCAELTEAARAALALSRNPAWKLRAPDETSTIHDGHYGPFTQNPARDIGDFIIRRADGVYAYQLAVSVDDMLMGVTRVVRGRDLLSSAPRQKWLIETLGGAAPAYCHCPLLTGVAGKLSKRLGSLSTETLRREYRGEEIVGRLAFLCGLTDRDAPVSARELVSVFSWEKIDKEDILLDL
jgi:glutamyl-tRNA synthetase